MLTPQELLSYSLLWMSQISNRARCPLTHIGHRNTLSPWSCGFSLCLAIICSLAVGNGYSLLTRPHLRRADAALIKALFTADFLSPLVELQTHFQIFPWRKEWKDHARLVAQGPFSLWVCPTGPSNLFLFPPHIFSG